MKTRIMFFLIAIGFLLITCNSNKNNNDNIVNSTKSQAICDDNTARLIGKLYYIASPLFAYDNWSLLDTFVKNNREILLPDSPLIQCMKLAGNNMILTNSQTLDPQSGNRAYESVLNMGGSIEDANRIKSNFDRDEIQLASLGIELLWLSDVLPKGAQGDWTDFLNTGTESRKLAIQGINVMLISLQMYDETEMFNYFLNSFKQYGPYLEYQTALMVSSATK